MQTNKKDISPIAGSATFQEMPGRISEFQRFRRVFFGRRVVVFGFIIILLLIITAIFAPLLSPYDP